jgi:hypothetical protein
MRRLVSEVLAGRRSVREVLRSKEFNDAGVKRLANAEKGIERLTDEQRAELFDPDRERTPADVLDTLRDRYLKAGSPVQDGGKPAVEEDEDFSQRTVLKYE